MTRVANAPDGLPGQRPEQFYYIGRLL